MTINRNLKGDKLEKIVEEVNFIKANISQLQF
jgi:hypothetical protein